MVAAMSRPFRRRWQHSASPRAKPSTTPTKSAISTPPTCLPKSRAAPTSGSGSWRRISKQTNDSFPAPPENALPARLASPLLGGYSLMSTETVICSGRVPRMESPFVGKTQMPDPFTLVLFGATGDLAGRKLLPALSRLMANGYLPPDFAIVGIGRREKNDTTFRDEVRKTLIEFGAKDSACEHFLARVYYQRTDFTTADGMKELARRIGGLEKERQLPGNRLYYLATDPEFFRPPLEGLG